MKKIALILTLVLLSSCTESVEIVKPEVTLESSTEKLYSIGSELTFSVPASGYTMISGSTEGKASVKITYDNSDLAMTLTIVTDLSQIGGMEEFDLEPLSVSQLLRDFSTGSPSENCEAHFADKGGDCQMADDIVEVVPLVEGRRDTSIDEYLVVQYPYGKGEGVAGLVHIVESINLDPTDLELASATNIVF